MEVKSIVLCDSAVTHPDGTFSLLRGGIDTWAIASTPAQIRFSFVVILELLSVEADAVHVAELDVIDADGRKIIAPAKIRFSIPKKENVTRYKWNLVGGNITILIKKHGTYSFQVRVDGQNLSSAEFQAVPVKK